LVSGGIKLVRADLARRFGAARAAALVEEAARSWPFLEELIAREGLACHYRRTGRFIGAHCPKAHAALARRADELRELTGMPVTVVPRERQREEVGSDYYFGGLTVEASGALHPALYHRGLAAAARRAGARVLEGARVERIARPGGGRAVLTTTAGEVRAEAVMAATNGYTGAVTPWLRRRLIPLGSYIIATEPLDPETARRLVPRGRMLVDTKRVLSYYRLSPDGTRVVFGGRASFRPASAREVAPRLHGFMTAVWPELARTRITHAWTGNVAFTFDLVPHMGVHDGIHYAAGCQGSGVAMATYLGYRTALTLAGKAAAPSAFEGLPFPTRPLYRGRPWFLPAVGSAYRLADWLERRLAA
jgi:glycine/D-amino acid oxidase-like deaminating enzyme